jgi:cytoskeleton protein RodZ
MTDHHEIEDLFAPDEPQKQKVAAVRDAEKSGDSIGASLRAAREARKLSLADCGRELRLPIKVLQRLESEDFGESEHFVFLRGALKSYAKFLGLPPGSCDDALRAVAPVEQPALVSVARTSRTRWLLQRYGTAATYIVLTATIAVPLVLLGLRGGLQRPAARIVSLDQPGSSAQTAAVSSTKPRIVVPPPDATPFRASMTPFAAIGLNDDSQPVATVKAAIPPTSSTTASGQHTLTLAASADCWFEITNAGGDKIDSGMLHAGDSRTWHSAGPLHVTLGNADGVAVTRDGQAMALDAYRHANVARFDVFGSSSASEND